MGSTPDMTLVPCRGGPCAGYGFLVPLPLPLEVERDPDGIYVLDEAGTTDEPGPVYVYVTGTLS